MTQLALVALAALTYFGVRGLTEANQVAAVAHAHDVLRFEHGLGLDVEHRLQAAVIGHHAIVTAMNWVYIWGHWPAIIATLVWLYRSDRDGYRLLRNAMFVSGAIGLVVFAAFPVAPPRLADLGLIDTVTAHSSSYRVLQPPSLVNRYAAVPSLHVGWNLLVGVFLWRHAGGRLRAVAVASPALMFAAVVLTANHFVVDGLAGMTVAAVGLVSATAVRRLVLRPAGQALGGLVLDGTVRSDNTLVIHD
ncbi:MAG: phosphatase PAP2 family protein [Acidimicrobiales bacterium]